MRTVDELWECENNVMTLYFDVDENRFIDEFGSIVDNPFIYITPNQLYIFKTYKYQYVVQDVTNSFLVEMVWPDEEEYEDWPGYNYEGKTY